MKRSTTMPADKAAKKILCAVGVAAFWLTAWALGAARVGKPLVLPSPALVAQRLCTLCVTAQFWRATALSLLRVMAGYAIGVAGGIITAVLCRISRVFSALISPVIRAVRAAPVVSFIILIWIWFSSDSVPVVIAALMVLPVIWQDVGAGIASTDGGLLEMARVFGFGGGQRLRQIYIPSVLPYFRASAQVALGLAWKSGIAAEVISSPAVAIGRELENGKIYLETADVFLWTFVVILLSLLLEKVVAGLIGGGRAHG